MFWIPVASTVLGYSLYQGLTTPLEAVALFPLGFFTWQLLEYWIHKKIFHTWPGPTAHGFHHTYPDDDTRLVMPLTISIALASIIGGGLYLLQRPDLTIPYWAGIVFGYLWYDFLHWSTHHRRAAAPPGASGCARTTSRTTSAIPTRTSASATCGWTRCSAR